MTSKKELALSHGELIRSLHYCPVTGKFTWLKSFHSSRIGKEAGSNNHHGYWVIGLNRKIYLAHRLAWFYVHGRWPAIELDHIDRDTLNNRLANLRECTRGQNIANRGVFKSGVTGLKGAAFVKKTGRYQAQIRENGRMRCLGQFATPEAAHDAYMREARRIHGEFASC